MHAVQVGRHAVQAGMHAVQAGTHAVQAGRHAVQAGRHAVQAGRHAVQAGRHAVQAGRHAVQAGRHAVQAGTHVVQAGLCTAPRLHSPTTPKEKTSPAGSTLPREKSSGGMWDRVPMDFVDRCVLPWTSARDSPKSAHGEGGAGGTYRLGF